MADYWNTGGEPVSHEDVERMFGDMLDECYEPTTFGELVYMPSDVLKSTDPIAFRCGVVDYLDSLVTDGELFETWEEYADECLYLEDDEDAEDDAL